ncbi:hypothetical protein VNI00_012648 [Paramarasmius palmivorus]|uniref:Uncharacterized protein n=1 Tax=Paramarasmius palmivorus TaxID=297713 RepID=A0AAW0C2X3_9AGAR
MAEDDELLSILQAHGEQFMSSFSDPSVNATAKKRRVREEQSQTTDEESEWGGIRSSGSEDDGDDEEECSDFEHTDDEFVQGSSTSPNVIVYSEARTSKPMTLGKAFMSSKISKLGLENMEQKKTQSIEDDEKERSNLENDAILHRLIHTKLLSGSLNPDLELTHAQRQKALSGRVLELAGSAKLGLGEKSVRRHEHNKASKRVREGLMTKEKERQKARVEEAKNLGNYHPRLKRLFEDPLQENKSKKRQRGLQMGIGKFSGGTLKLSKDEINLVQGQSQNTGRGGRGRRGKGRK